MFVGFSVEYLKQLAIAWGIIVFALVLFVVFRPWRSPKRSVKFLVRAYASVWITTALLLTIESAFAFFYDTTDSFGLTSSNRRWYERHVVYNNWGSRDAKQFRLQTPDKRRRITIVGDSFSFGHGIADIRNRFGDILEQRCAEASDWELYNLALPAHTTKHCVDQLDTVGRRGFETDLLLYVYVLNDIENLLEDNAHIMGSIILDQPENKFIRDFYLPNFLYYRYRQYSRPEVRGYFGWLSDAYQGEPWARQQEFLDKLRIWASEKRAELLVVIFPFMVNLGSDYAFRHAHETLGNYFAKHEVAYLDLLPLFEKHRDENLVVNKYDAHPNEFAHRLAADEIWNRLLRNKVSEVTSQ